MLHILYGLVCRENFVGDEVCYIVKNVENHCTKPCMCMYVQFHIYYLKIYIFGYSDSPA